MFDSRNFGTLTCGITMDPEWAGNSKNILKLRVAANFAGSGPLGQSEDDKRGFFNVTMFINEDNRNAQWVKKMIEDGKITKGSQIQVLYSLREDRFKTKDGANASRVDLIAEVINYAGGSKPEGASASAGSSSSSSSDEPVDLPTQF